MTQTRARTLRPMIGGLVSYAKDHEDEWLLEQFPDDFTGYAVELGALDGTYISCTRLLEERGWDVLCIEPNPRHQEALRACRKRVLTCACVESPRPLMTMWEWPGIVGNTLTSETPSSGASVFVVTGLTLDQCLMVSRFPRLDVLVLDVDGKETEILRGFDVERWKPKAVIIEGDADGRLQPFLSRGYRQVGVRTDDNRLLVKEAP